MSVLNFYRGLSQCLSGHKPLSKLLAFKLIVGLSFLERVSQDKPRLSISSAEKKS